MSRPWTLFALLFAILACVVALALLESEPECVKYAEAPKGVMLQLPYKPVCAEWK